MLQLHLSAQQFYGLLRCDLYYRFDGIWCLLWIFLAATKQLYEWFSPSVCTGNWSSLSLPVQTCIMLWVCSYWEMSVSVCLSVTPFSLCSFHRIIMKFSEVITIGRSDVHEKGQSQRSKVKVTEVMTPLSPFRTVTLVWIHIWWWNDAYSLIMLRRGALLFFKVICQISRSHGSFIKSVEFDPDWAFPDS